MKDPQKVLREKEREVDRVREEVQALRTVIPLLADDRPPSDVVHELQIACSRTPPDPSEDDMAQLELYYPFVRRLRMSEQEKR